MKGTKGYTLVEVLVVAAILALLAALLFPVFAGAREKAHQAACANNLKQLGTAFQLYLQDWDGSLPNQYDPSQGLDPTPPWRFATWKDALFPYLGSLDVYHCPSNSEAWAQFPPNRPAFLSYEANPVTGDFTERFPRSYVLNTQLYWDPHWLNRNVPPPDYLEGFAVSAINNPSDTVLLIESRSPNPTPDITQILTHTWLGVGSAAQKDALNQFGIQIHAGDTTNWLFVDGRVKPMRVSQTLAPVYLWSRTGRPIGAGFARFVAELSSAYP